MDHIRQMKPKRKGFLAAASIPLLRVIRNTMKLTMKFPHPSPRYPYYALGSRSRDA
ncbi:hypothetical protein BC939DRAFT_454900 [Gamsiella multidivaricata]|uniref:uncharacterized protein n=1 Tax=Gamsiella multidivaricata TaxID=101098 RepID=UPI00221F49C9|nr:uncharacterized protein BC939DRAFT_454900 [Gamsiella multidivaricata]KAI7821911.1 hypothetical protein BC939DRAFT_454900 [Gamsiella multidivaricata]